MVLLDKIYIYTSYLVKRGERVKFTKMHGCGNDYIYINCFEENIQDPSALSIKMSNRHFGVGSDGLILILPSQIADFRMRMFNSDGSESEMCGNGIRCVGKYVYDRGLTQKTSVKIETLAGIKELNLIVEEGTVKQVQVDMGEPALDADRIPVNSENSPVIKLPIEMDSVKYEFTCVSMGNPHAITFVDDVNKVDIDKVGAYFEKHHLFPNRTNVEFVQVVNSETVKMRVYERGAGETLACGTGSCATLVACVLNNLTKNKVLVQLLGGDLLIEWDDKTNHVLMTGPAQFVFDGEWLE